MIVEEFLTAWATPLRWRDAIGEHFSADCAYENVELSKTVGPGEAIALIEVLINKVPFHYMTVQMHHLLESGPLVITERTDYFHRQNGEVILSLRIMGIFEIAGGKIAAWRDYCDMSTFKFPPPIHPDVRDLQRHPALD